MRVKERTRVELEELVRRERGQRTLSLRLASVTFRIGRFRRSCLG